MRGVSLVVITALVAGSAARAPLRARSVFPGILDTLHQLHGQAVEGKPAADAVADPLAAAFQGPEDVDEAVPLVKLERPAEDRPVELAWPVLKAISLLRPDAPRAAVDPAVAEPGSAAEVSTVMLQRAVMSSLLDAISDGSEAYNNKQFEDCQTIYSRAVLHVTQLLIQLGDSVTAKQLSAALATATEQPAQTACWTLRMAAQSVLETVVALPDWADATRYIQATYALDFSGVDQPVPDAIILCQRISRQSGVTPSGVRFQRVSVVVSPCTADDINPGLTVVVNSGASLASSSLFSSYDSGSRGYFSRDDSDSDGVSGSDSDSDSDGNGALGSGYLWSTTDSDYSQFREGHDSIAHCMVTFVLVAMGILCLCMCCRSRRRCQQQAAARKQQEALAAQAQAGQPFKCTILPVDSLAPSKKDADCCGGADCRSAERAAKAARREHRASRKEQRRLRREAAVDAFPGAVASTQAFEEAQRQNAHALKEETARMMAAYEPTPLYSTRAPPATAFPGAVAQSLSVQRP